MCYFITWNSKQTPIPRKKKKIDVKYRRNDIDRRAFEKFSKSIIDDRKKRASEGLACKSTKTQTNEGSSRRCSLRPNSQLFLFVPLLFFLTMRYNVGCIASLLALSSAFTATCSRGWTIMNMQPFQSYWRFEITGARASCICERRASLSKLFLRSKSAIVRDTSPKNEQHRADPSEYLSSVNLTGSKGWFGTNRPNEYLYACFAIFSFSKKFF